MKQTIVHDEGIILRETPFQEDGKILTLFTKSRGIIRIFQKRGLRAGALIGPLMRVDIVYREREGKELMVCREVSVIDSYLLLRASRSMLESACGCLEAIRISQMEGKPAEPLYILLSRLLEEIPSFSDPHSAVAFLQVKILQWEGFVTVPPECSVCHKKLQERFYSGEFAFCSTHSLELALFYTEEESALIDSLVTSRSFKTLREKQLSATFKEKVKIWTSVIHKK